MRPALVAAALLVILLLAFAWRAFWKQGDAIRDPYARWAAFAVIVLCIVALMAFGMPKIVTPVAVLTGMIGGFYIGRGFEQAKLIRLLEAPRKDAP